MTDREDVVALEIRRLARDDLGLSWEGPDDAPLAGHLDSLALLSLVVAVEDRYRVRLAEEELAGARTLADFARVVAGKLAARAGTEAPP